MLLKSCCCCLSIDAQIIIIISVIVCPETRRQDRSCRRRDQHYPITRRRSVQVSVGQEKGEGHETNEDSYHLHACGTVNENSTTVVVQKPLSHCGAPIPDGRDD